MHVISWDDYSNFLFTFCSRKSTLLALLLKLEKAGTERRELEKIADVLGHGHPMIYEKTTFAELCGVRSAF